MLCTKYFHQIKVLLQWNGRRSLLLAKRSCLLFASKCSLDLKRNERKHVKADDDGYIDKGWLCKKAEKRNVLNKCWAFYAFFSFFLCNDFLFDKLFVNMRNCVKQFEAVHYEGFWIEIHFRAITNLLNIINHDFLRLEKWRKSFFQLNLQGINLKLFTLFYFWIEISYLYNEQKDFYVNSCFVVSTEKLRNDEKLSRTILKSFQDKNDCVYRDLLNRILREGRGGEGLKSIVTTLWVFVRQQNRALDIDTLKKL